MNTQEVIEKVKADPRTTWIGVVLGALFLLGKYLATAAIEPWGSMVLGVAGFGACGCLVFTRFSPPKTQPDDDPEKTPPLGTTLK